MSEFSRRMFLEVAGAALAGGMLPGFLRDEALAVGEKHPLTAREERKLAEVSLTYLAPSMEEAIEVSKRINWKPDNEFEWPDNMCGPLAIDQLIKAGLLPVSTDLNQFWLLDLDVNQQTLEKTFPKDRYDWFRTETAVADYDFGADPLFPGDFVYTFGGSYEHMLIVNRMDNQGRVYSVTNLLTGKLWRGRSEMVIREAMLFDPADPTVGQLYEWRYGQRRSQLGTTGVAGFGRWRRKLDKRMGVPKKQPGK